MPRSTATTVDEYLLELPLERRAQLEKVRTLVLENLPEGYRESMNWGMISYELPLESYPDTYNRQPLGYAALAAQKNYNALYLTAAYADPAQQKRLQDGFARAGKKLDMGKSCVRFRTTDDLALDVIAEVIASTPPRKLIEQYEASRKR